MSERFVDKLGSGNVEPLDSYQRGCSLDEHNEGIALLDLQILEITSFVKTTQLLQRSVSNVISVFQHSLLYSY